MRNVSPCLNDFVIYNCSIFYLLSYAQRFNFKESQGWIDIIIWLNWWLKNKQINKTDQGETGGDISWVIRLWSPRFLKTMKETCEGLKPRMCRHSQLRPMHAYHFVENILSASVLHAWLIGFKNVFLMKESTIYDETGGRLTVIVCNLRHFFITLHFHESIWTKVDFGFRYIITFQNSCPTWLRIKVPISWPVVWG